MVDNDTTDTEVSVSEVIGGTTMTSPSVFSVATALGRLGIRQSGTGPPVVLWHSLFVDSGSWGGVVDDLSVDRTVYTVDGPSHGTSDPVHRDFTFDECVAAAEQTLDRLGLDEPVDWVGNAWGGHVGIHLAATHPSRLRTLTTIGTPVRGFTAWEKGTKGWPLVTAYRVAIGFILKQLSESLIGADATRAHPDQAAAIMASFRDADRNGMLHAMRSMMMQRSGIEDLLPRISVPTLVMPVRDDVMGWRPDEARRTCAAIPNCRVEEVAGTGHVTPLLVERDRIGHLLRDFWRVTSAPNPNP
jgi:pimeloyl-ACP methyl ester carboxylesterase